MKRVTLFFALSFLILSFRPETDSKTKKDAQIEVKIKELISRMTLDEKIGQLNQLSGPEEITGPTSNGSEAKQLIDLIKNGQVGVMSNVMGASTTREVQKLVVENSRLGIPILFGYDVVHGYKTIFPIPLGEAASWEPELARRTSQVAALESSAAGLKLNFAPMVDISRDARWGRVMEGAGEDSYLGSLFAAARVKGFQGDDLSDIHTVAACAKHFAGYGFVEAGRDYNTVDISENRLRNEVLPPFKACLDAGVATFMNAFNEIGGTPATSNTHLLRDILKGEWNFDGFVVSDWNSIGELIGHGVARNKEEAANLAIHAGADTDLEGNCYITELKKLVLSGKVDEKLIDDAVSRVLRIKYRVGLFDNPYKYSDENREKNLILTKENLAVAREAARKSIVLLKNERNLLPLKKDGQKIAVIGELSADKDTPLGNWRAKGIENSAISLLEGLKAATRKSTITFAKGPVYVSKSGSLISEIEINTTNRNGIDEAVILAKKSDLVVMALGENCYQSGEGRSQADIGLKGLQKELFDAIYAANKNIVVVLMNGRPLDISDLADEASAIVEAWHLGSEAGNGIADVLFGDYNPSGKLPVSFPRSVGQIPVYYNHTSSGRPDNEQGNVFWSHYSDLPNEPIFPFGYGLSYTTFDYSNLELSAPNFSKGEKLQASITLKNTGKLAGEEVVQLYIRDLFGGITRPVKELKGFQKVMLQPGESKEITFTITDNDLAFYGADQKFKAEPGDFKLWIGPDSSKGLEGGFELK